MNTKEIYVGTRKKSHELTDIIGREIYHLNEGLSKKLRSSVLKKGIKKTEQRKRLEFLVITQEELKKFKNEIVPLVTINKEKMVKSLNSVNSRYTRITDWKTGQKYKQELESSLEDCVTVIGKDTNFRNKPVQRTDTLRRNTKLFKDMKSVDVYKSSSKLYELNSFFHKIINSDYYITSTLKVDDCMNPYETHEIPNKNEKHSVWRDGKIHDNFQQLVWDIINSSQSSHYYHKIYNKYYEEENEWILSYSYSFDGFTEGYTLKTTEDVNELYKLFLKRKF